MWAADIPHVNHLQFLNVDRLGFQEKLSRKEARDSRRKGFQGVPFLPNKGLPAGLPVLPIGWRQLFPGGPPHFSSRTGMGRGTPTAVPWLPLDTSQGDLRQLWEALHPEPPGLAVGRGRGGNQASSRSQGQRHCGRLGGDQLTITGPLTSFPTNSHFCCSPERCHTWGTDMDTEPWGAL